jgi:hypothetical protein
MDHSGGRGHSGSDLAFSSMRARSPGMTTLGSRLEMDRQSEKASEPRTLFFDCRRPPAGCRI